MKREKIDVKQLLGVDDLVLPRKGLILTTIIYAVLLGIIEIFGEDMAQAAIDCFYYPDRVATGPVNLVITLATIGCFLALYRHSLLNLGRNQVRWRLMLHLASAPAADKQLLLRQLDDLCRTMEDGGSWTTRGMTRQVRKVLSEENVRQWVIHALYGFPADFHKLGVDRGNVVQLFPNRR